MLPSPETRACRVSRSPLGAAGEGLGPQQVLPIGERGPMQSSEQRIGRRVRCCDDVRREDCDVNHDLDVEAGRQEPSKRAQPQSNHHYSRRSTDDVVRTGIGAGDPLAYRQSGTTSSGDKDLRQQNFIGPRVDHPRDVADVTEGGLTIAPSRANVSGRRRCRDDGGSEDGVTGRPHACGVSAASAREVKRRRKDGSGWNIFRLWKRDDKHGDGDDVRYDRLAGGNREVGHESSAEAMSARTRRREKPQHLQQKQQQQRRTQGHIHQENDEQHDSRQEPQQTQHQPRSPLVLTVVLAPPDSATVHE